jgi:hypothetical protein
VSGVAGSTGMRHWQEMAEPINSGMKSYIQTQRLNSVVLRKALRFRFSSHASQFRPKVVQKMENTSLDKNFRSLGFL